MIKILVTTDTEQTEYIIRAMSTEKQTELLEDLRDMQREIMDDVSRQADKDIDVQVIRHK